MRKAKIVCTIGPASAEPAILERLIESGMDVARLNFSHGTHDSHRAAIASIRSVAERLHRPVAIMQDLQGPRIRIGALEGAGVEVAAEQRIRLVGGMLRSGGQIGGRTMTPSNLTEIPVTYPQLAQDLRPGARVLVDDGLIELLVTAVSGGAVECRVKTGGRILSHKGINLPGTTMSVPTLTEKDRKDIRFGVAESVDYMALSFVRGPEDVQATRRLVAECGGDQPIIAKIERAEAITALDALLEEADGVMIARGDLGVEMGPEVVPILQKRIITQANRHRRLVITATQMLESMTQHPSPTRAEASDVANAIFDGTDAVMLSAETARGQYPVESVQVMDRIVRVAEGEAVPLHVGPVEHATRRECCSIPEAMCGAAASAAAATEAAAIATFSESGSTARLLSKQRPVAPIVAFTPHAHVQRRMALYWGVLPRMMARVQDPDKRVLAVEHRLVEEMLAESSDCVVFLSGAVTGELGGTNAMKLHRIPS
ncbi:MAG: pyruvate kinase [Nitrospira sp. CG24E]|nr:MAG: pyruvate kinase [Nitrospira sp. CG24E]